MFPKISILLLVPLLFFACKEKQKSTSTDQEETNKETYFSVTQFLDDQWANRHGIPYTLQRVTVLNGRSDTTYVLLDSTLWQNIRAQFDAADISEVKFLDRYQFSFVEDNTTETNNLMYEAKEEDLFLQSMVVAADMFTDMVRTVYLETKDTREGYTRTQKLSYIPDQVIQIQEFEKSSATPKKELLIQYKFEY